MTMLNELAAVATPKFKLNWIDNDSEEETVTWMLKIRAIMANDSQPTRFNLWLVT
jgi:hypothetical protein